MMFDPCRSIRCHATLLRSVLRSRSRRGVMMNQRAVLLIKTVHTAIFLWMSACILYVLFAGLTQSYDWKLAVAIGMVLLESAVYLVNGRRCPLTHWAQHYGDPTGNDLIADIFLPPSFARKIPPLCGGLFVFNMLVLLVSYLFALR